MRRILVSAGASGRLLAAKEWLASRERALILAPSLDAAAEVSRAALRTASFGWQRFTLPRFAELLAQPKLAELGLAPLSSLGLFALCARVVHRLAAQDELGKFQPLATRPGLARALSSTLLELRLAGARPSGAIGRILEEYELELEQQRFADRARVLQLAIEAPHQLLELPALLVDLPLKSPLEETLLARLRSDVLAVAPSSDAASIARALGVAPEPLPQPASNSLTRVQQGLFEEQEQPPSALDENVVLLSAPGEARECVEIARLIRREAQRGVPFDEMAVLLRAPAQYRSLLREAFARAEIPAHFSSGTLEPHPAGRAFLALLACAQDGLSARRFAEYLSLGEVPKAVQGEPPPPLPSEDRVVAAEEDERPEREESELRVPVRWERLLVEAKVIGGIDRWQRRLQQLEPLFEKRIAEAKDDEGRIARLQRDLEDLRALKKFALPLLEDLAALPEHATWGKWVNLLSAIASRSLRTPEHVQRLLQELMPMSEVGPVSLMEVRLVLGKRLTDLSMPPLRKHRHGAVYVAETSNARGLSFETVFVPGLAERLFPQKVLEDPLLRDGEREEFPELQTSEDRIAQERLALRLAVGAARRKAVLSWPRIDLTQGRARVPSFYGLEILRAGEGKLPAFSELALRAEGVAQARAGWPAPLDPRDAIDEAEHDLALLARAILLPDEERKGAAAYLLNANRHLYRALRSRARRWNKRWSYADGLVELGVPGQDALREHLPLARAYSPTALQNYAACPYKFVLQAVHRLGPREVPEAIDEIDPLSRGAMIHEVQFELLTKLREQNRLPLEAQHLEEAQQLLRATLHKIAGNWRDDLAPAIEGVWTDCIAGVEGDLREWLRRISEEKEWTPWRFELAFGLDTQADRDEHSRKEPVRLDEGLLLRGSIDLVERKADGSLRATDYKTGKAWAKEGVVIGGGATLQPALYAMVLQKLFPELKIEGGRLWYCTYAGDFRPVEVPLDVAAQGSVQLLAQTLTQAIESGFLPAAPRERECARCDYLTVCGPDEEKRTKRKPKPPLEPLKKLREQP